MLHWYSKVAIILKKRKMLSDNYCEMEEGFFLISFLGASNDENVSSCMRLPS